MVAQIDVKRLQIGFASSLLAGSVITAGINPQARGPAAAFGLLALAILAGVLTE